MIRVVSQLFQDETGASAIEYGLIASLVSVAAAGALGNMGGSLEAMFNSVSSTFKTSVSP